MSSVIFVGNKKCFIAGGVSSDAHLETGIGMHLWQITDRPEYLGGGENINYGPQRVMRTLRECICQGSVQEENVWG